MSVLVDKNNENGIDSVVSYYRDLTPDRWIWLSQSFTASESYTIKSAKLFLARTNAADFDDPGIVRLDIKNTAVSGVPAGDSLAFGTTNGNTLQDVNTGGSFEWREFTLNTAVSLSSGSVYSLVLHIPDLTSGQYHVIVWQYNINTYTDGIGWITNIISGTPPAEPGEDDWIEIASVEDEDLLFETYGVIGGSVPASFPSERPSAYVDDNLADKVWDPIAGVWTTPGALTTAGGGRFHRQVVAVGGFRIYYGDL